MYPCRRLPIRGARLDRVAVRLQGRVGSTMTRVVTVSKLALVIVVAFAAVLTSAAVAPRGASAADEASCLSTAEKQFLSLINQYRASKGLGALTASKALNVASYKHSLDMGTRKYFSHSTKLPLPAGQSGPSPWDRMREDRKSTR